MNVSTDVLAVLSTSLRFDAPDRAVIVQKLERGLYSKVAKVLEACGGDWNKRAKAHLFDVDARAGFTAEERIEQVIMTGTVAIARDDLAFFATPEALALRLVDLADVQRGHYVLEPSAGTGRIVAALLDRGAFVAACERDVKMRAELFAQSMRGVIALYDQDDFLDVSVPAVPNFDRVAMNPPFKRIGAGDHLDHVRHAHAMLREGGRLAAILPTSITFRQDRRHREFREFVDQHDGSVHDVPPGSFKESGTGVNTCIVVVPA